MKQKKEIFSVSVAELDSNMKVTSLYMCHKLHKETAYLFFHTASLAPHNWRNATKIYANNLILSLKYEI